MNLKVLSAQDYLLKLKATIQATGKLGFSDDAAKEFGFGEAEKFIKILMDSDTEDLYMIIMDTGDDDAFKVCKAGQYYYLPTTQLFSSLDKPYKDETIIFDLSRKPEIDSSFNGVCYKMNERRIPKNADK